MTNTNDILAQFHTVVGDETELSTTEELALLNKIYNEVLRAKQWEFLKKEATGTINGTDLTQPSDFSNLTDPIIYVGASSFKVVPFTERRLYTNQGGYAYYDARQGKFIFTRSVEGDYSFDYIYTPSALTISGSNPVFPSRFWGLLPFLMAVDNDFLQLADKARSYAGENRQRGQQILTDMEMWNDKISGYNTYGN